MDEQQTRYLMVGACVLLVCSIIGLGAGELAIWTSGKSYTKSEEACPSLPNLTSLTAEKKLLSQWHWKYNFIGSKHVDTSNTQSVSGSITLNCPTMTKDVNFYLDDNLVARSDGKIATTVSKTYIRDCHGDILYVTQTGSALTTIINGNRIQVSFQLMDKDNANLLAYVDGTHFFSDNIDIKDLNGTVVANMVRNPWTSFPWQWSFTINNYQHPGADLRVLTLIAGKTAFTDGGNNDKDMCNSFFFTVGWLLLAIGIILIIGIFMGIKMYGTQCKEKCRRDGYGRRRNSEEHGFFNTSTRGPRELAYSGQD